MFAEIASVCPVNCSACKRRFCPCEQESLQVVLCGVCFSDDDIPTISPASSCTGAGPAGAVFGSSRALIHLRFSVAARRLFGSFGKGYRGNYPGRVGI